MDEMDYKTTTEELSKVIGVMAPWNATGSDCILADLLSHCK